MELVKYACYGLEKIYKNGYNYKKAGVIVTEIMPENQVIGALFDEVDRPKHKKAMLAMDRLNARFGREKIRIGSQGFGRKWFKSGLLFCASLIIASVARIAMTSKNPTFEGIKT